MKCTGCGQENPEGMSFCGKCGATLDTPAYDALPQIVMSSDFVGRQREMGELVAALDDALEGRGRLVMLAGEPGIGKTRLAQELAAISEERGARVLWGRCYEGEGAPPYWPWVQPIRTYIEDNEPEHIASVMDAGAADIAEIIPQLRHKLPDLQPSPSLEPEAARFRLFDSVTTFLKKASDSQPLVLILDNLHWADRTSLLLLEFLASELEHSHILVLGTYRDVDVSRRHPLSQTLGVLIREQLFQRVQLRGMTLEEVRRFIEITSEGSVPSDVVYAVHSRTEGNPLFVTEVVRLLKQEGFEEVEGLDVRIPEGIRDAIGRRLSRLSEGCNEVLTTASVIGREFSLTQLERLVDGPSTSSERGLSVDELLGILEEAAGAYVIEEVEGGIGTYRFTHALIQQTLASELSTTRRVRIHSLIAEVLEEIHADDLEAHAEELAHHYAEAATMIGPGKMVHYSMMVGERSLASFAWEDAQAHFERALAAKEGQPPPIGSGQRMDAEMAALLLGLGKAQQFSHHWEEALESLSRALDYFEKVGDVTSAIMTGDCSFFPGASPQFQPILARVLQIVPPESYEAGRLLSRYVQCLAWVGDYEGFQHAFGHAISISRREGDKFLEMWTLERATVAERFFLRFDESLANAMACIQMASRVDNPMAECHARHHAAQVFLCYLGDLERARFHVAHSLEPAERTHQVLRIAHALEGNERVASAAGDWAAARGFSDRHLELGSFLTEGEQLASRAMLEYQTGEFEQFEFYLGRLRERINSGASPVLMNRSWIVELARMSDTTGDLNVVKAAAEEVLSSLMIPYFIKTAKVALALTALQEGDAALSGELYNSLKPFRGTLDYDGLISLDRLLALLISATGRFDDAVAHFEDALAFCRNAGYRPELAWTCHDYAAMIIGSSLKPASTDAHEKVMSLLEEALAISTELGMKPLMDKAFALKEQALASPVKSASYPDGLTDREVEVLRLIAAGMTDRQIADDLVISVRTVGNHVVSILNKTTTANRTEAAIYANRHGLVS